MESLGILLAIACAPLPFDLITCWCWIRKLRNDGVGNSGCTPVPMLIYAMGFALLPFRDFLLRGELSSVPWRSLPALYAAILMMIVIHVVVCYYIPAWVHQRWLQRSVPSDAFLDEDR